MIGMVTLTYEGRTIEVMAGVLDDLMEDASQRMDERVEEVEKHPSDYEDWDREWIRASTEAREKIVALLQDKPKES